MPGWGHHPAPCAKYSVRSMGMTVWSVIGVGTPPTGVTRTTSAQRETGHQETGDQETGDQGTGDNVTTPR